MPGQKLIPKRRSSVAECLAALPLGVFGLKLFHQQLFRAVGLGNFWDFLGSLTRGVTAVRISGTGLDFFKPKNCGVKDGENGKRTMDVMQKKSLGEGIEEQVGIPASVSSAARGG